MDKLISALIVSIFGAFAAYDIFLEASEASTSHIIAESTLVFVAFVWASFLIIQLLKTRKNMQLLQADVEHWRQESNKWAQGLAESIDRQFDAWKLTPAEKEVAMLLMKGLDHKSIAEIRGTTERTARQQAVTLYQKSAMAGRAELTAFFLEDLLVPAQRAEISGPMSLGQ